MVLHGLGIIIWLTSLPRNINFRLAAGRWWLSRNVRVTLSCRWWWWWWPRSITVRLSDAISSRRAPPYPPIYPHYNILSCIATFIDRFFLQLTCRLTPCTPEFSRFFLYHPFICKRNFCQVQQVCAYDETVPGNADICAMFYLYILRCAYFIFGGRKYFAYLQYFSFCRSKRLCSSVMLFFLKSEKAAL